MATKKNYVCRFCGEEFENLVECVRHEGVCATQYEKKQAEEKRKIEKAEKEEKLRVLKEKLRNADTLVREKYNDYVSALNEHAKIKKEIDKIEFGEKNFDTVSHFMDLFDF